MDVRLIGEIVIAVCAVAALALSVYQEVVRRRRDRPRLIVTIEFGFVVRSPLIMSDNLCIVRARNLGKQPVIIVDRPSVLLPNGTELELRDGNVELPHDLAPGRLCSFAVSVHELTAYLRKNGIDEMGLFAGVYRNLAGHRYTSEPIEFDSSKWRKTTNEKGEDAR